MELEAALNEHITMYVDDVLVWGTEPDGTKPDVTSPTTKPTDKPTNSSSSSEILYGDANEDGEVNVADAVMIMQVLSNPNDYKFTKQGQKNADVVGKGDGVTAKDALAIQMIGINLVKQTDFPLDDISV